MKKRILALLLAVLMVLSLVACGSKSAPKEEPKKEEETKTEAKEETKQEETKTEAPAEEERPVLRAAIDVEPGSMWIFGGTSSGGGANVMRHVYDSLIQFGPGFELLPCLAKSWEQVDSLHYRFFLHEGVVDTRGNAITAEDALFSLWLCTQNGEDQMTVKYIDFDNSVAEDDTTLLVALNESNAFQFQNIAKVKIIDKQAYEADPEGFIADPCGCGPYKLVEYVPGSKIVLTYNETYYGEEPYFKDVIFYIISEPSQRTSALENGEIDVDLNLQSSDFDYVNSLPNCESLGLDSNRAEGMWLNTSENSVLHDINLRKAVALAIDNEALAAIVYQNMFSPAPGACAPALADYDPAYDNELYAAQDMEKAKQLVADAGAAGKPIVILTTGRADQIAASEMIQTWLNEAGFSASIQSMEDAVINEALANPAGGWDIGMTNFRCGSNYMLDMYNAYLGFLNYCAWSGPNYEKFIETAGKGCASTDPAVIKECTDTIINLIQEDVVLYNFAVAKNFKGKVANLNLDATTIYGD